MVGHRVPVIGSRQKPRQQCGQCDKGRRNNQKKIEGRRPWQGRCEVFGSIAKPDPRGAPSRQRPGESHRPAPEGVGNACDLCDRDQEDAHDHCGLKHSLAQEPALGPEGQDRECQAEQRKQSEQGSRT
jgi:hypothetical protein